MKEKYINSHDVAQMLGVCTKTVARMVRRRELPPPLPGRNIRWPSKEADTIRATNEARRLATASDWAIGRVYMAISGIDGPLGTDELAEMQSIRNRLRQAGLTARERVIGSLIDELNAVDTVSTKLPSEIKATISRLSNY